MNILESLVRLRDDIKIWTENNLNVLNEKIEKKTAVDNKLSSSSTNPVQNKVITNAINNIPRFSGDYNDLTNAPNITEDSAGNMIIADESGNIIFKADAKGVHTTELTLNGEAAATQAYVNEAVSKIDIPDVDFTGYATEEYVTNAIADLDIPETDLTDYYTKEETDTAINTAKEELSESIVAESDEWKVVDEAGNIIFSVDASGAHTTELTLNGERAATEQWVDNKKADIEHKHIIKDITDFPTNLATIDDVNNAIAEFIEADPVALEALQELSQALENHEDAYDALLETVGSKATPEDLENMKTELSESIVSEQQEFHVVDNEGNIVTSIDANGVTTTTVTAQNIIVNGDNVEEHIDNTDIHVTPKEKEAWNNKSNFSGSYNDLTDKPEPTDLSNYYTKTEVDEAITNNIPDVDLTGYATEEFVTTKISEAKLEGGDIDLSNYATKDDIKDFIPSEYITETELDAKGYLTEHQSLDGLATEQYVDDVKAELSESIVSENEEWHVADENGNIIFTVDSNGAHTTELMLNGENIRDIVGNKVEASENNGSIKIDGVDTKVYTHPDKHSISDVDGLQDALAGSGGAKTKTISLPSNSWTGASAPFSQIVTIDGVTANSKVDLQPSIEQLISLQNENVSLVVANNNGVVTVYALNYKPSVDFNMQTLISEVISS